LGDGRIIPVKTDLQERVTRNVKVLMALRGISDQKTLAAKLGWGADRVSTSFSGRRRWALDDLNELAAVFDLRPGDLLNDPAELVNVTAPARTGTDSVTGVNTRRYTGGNGARILQFPQRTGPQRRYRARKTGPGQRIGATSRAARGSSHLTAAAAR
jgi:hypothetical protein